MYIQLSASTQKRWETARLGVARFRKVLSTQNAPSALAVSQFFLVSRSAFRRRECKMDRASESALPLHLAKPRQVARASTIKPELREGRGF
jgi:hypothetical protein